MAFQVHHLCSELRISGDKQRERWLGSGAIPDPELGTDFGPIRGSEVLVRTRINALGARPWLVEHQALEVFWRECGFEDCQYLAQVGLPHFPALIPCVLGQPSMSAEFPRRPFKWGLVTLRHRGQAALASVTAVPLATRNSMDFPPPEISL